MQDCSPSAKPDRTILSSPEHQVSSSKNVLSLFAQNETSNFVTGISCDAGVNTGQKNRPQRRYMAKTQYRLVYAKVGHDVQSIDKAFKAINAMSIGDKIFSFAEYCFR